MKTIIFDVDDTIYNLMEPFERAHMDLYADQTDADCEELFKASRVHSDVAFYRVAEGKMPKEDEFAYRIIHSYQDVGIEVSKEEAKVFEEKYRYYQTRIHVPDGIKQILDLCVEKQIPIAVLTNGRVQNQGKKMDVLGLEHWFKKEHLFISEAIGATKPSREAFLAVQQALDVEPENTWFIGDTFEVDIDGACGAGWHSIWYNHRKRSMPEGEAKPDYEVRTEGELFQVIQKIIFE